MRGIKIKQFPYMNNICAYPTGFHISVFDFRTITSKRALTEPFVF
jgi:hypothetical protein